MKKIGIVTLYGQTNYGNKLQNYALVEYLKSNDFKVDTIVVDEKKKVRRFIANIYVKSKKYCNNFWKEIYSNKRIRKFKIFSNQYLSYRFLTRKQFFNLMDIDILIVGSDQVWNPSFIVDNEEVFYLSTLNKITKISYAASFGMSSIEKNHLLKMKSYLSSFKWISVRENEAKKLLNDYFENIDIVLDPVFLLSCDYWENSFNLKKPLVKERYILTYFLGKKDSTTDEQINELKNKSDIKLIELNSDEDYEYYDSDPQSFLNLFYNASVIFTDSFHGTAFSIIFKKDFYVFSRNSKNNMDSRITTILDIVDLKNRFNSTNFFAQEINYSRVTKLLQVKIDESKLKLLNNIG